MSRFGRDLSDHGAPEQLDGRGVARLRPWKTWLCAAHQSCYERIPGLPLSTPFPGEGLYKVSVQTGFIASKHAAVTEQGLVICSPERAAIRAGQTELPQPTF